MPDFSKLIAAAKGDIAADLLLKNCKIANLFSGKISTGNIAIYNGSIAGFGDYAAKQIIDIRGRLVAPGFIDGHVHIESSMLTPEHFAAAVITHGTTAIIADPHEIVNVLGLEGLNIFIERSRNLPVDIFFMMPSCIPATTMETAAVQIKAEDMKPWLNNKKILGLGEMMNFPGIINRDEGTLKKIDLYQHKLIDGHAPLLTGKNLSAYVAAGISSDHESSSFAEAEEKLEKGMFTLIREGSAAKNLSALLPLVNEHNSRFFGFCTDDRHPDFLMDKGHIDHIIKKSIALGLDPVTALQLSSLNTSRHYGLKKRGAIGIGYQADLVIFDDFKNMAIDNVIKDGKIVVEQGKLIHPVKTKIQPPRNSINIKKITRNTFSVKDTGNKVRVIKLLPEQLITKQIMARLKSENGELLPDIENDIIKLSVVERHHGTGNSCTSFVKGFEIKEGAICSTVAHDSHNLIILGTNNDDMMFCVKIITKMGGGLVVVKDGKLMASLALPFGGIMSENTLVEVRRDYNKVVQAAKNLGCKISDPFMTLSFLALPVIPDIKITDRGLVDVNSFDFIPLYQEGES